MDVHAVDVSVRVRLGIDKAVGVGLAVVTVEHSGVLVRLAVDDPTVTHALHPAGELVHP
jgi:hypothetical protein